MIAMLAAASLVGVASAEYTMSLPVLGPDSVTDYVTAVLTTAGEYFDARTVPWNNTTAIDVMNKDLGIKAMTDDLETYYHVVENEAYANLSLTFASAAYKVGDEVTIYLVVGATDASIDLYVSAGSGLNVTSVSVASSSGNDGFSDGVYSDGSVSLSTSSGTVLVKVTGTLTDQYMDSSDNCVVYVTASTTSVGFGFVAVSEAREAVPEPATATLSLLALAGLAARRRRE